MNEPLWKYIIFFIPRMIFGITISLAMLIGDCIIKIRNFFKYGTTDEFDIYKIKNAREVKEMWRTEHHENGARPIHPKL